MKEPRALAFILFMSGAISATGLILLMMGIVELPFGIVGPDPIKLVGGPVILVIGCALGFQGYRWMAAEQKQPTKEQE